MNEIITFSGAVAIPYNHYGFTVSLDGVIYDREGRSVTLEEFNMLSGTDVIDISVLVAITYQNFKWAPQYWKHLRALPLIEQVRTPESMVLGIDGAVMSLEYPGFYLIPNFSNYLVSPDGWLIKKSTGATIEASRGSLGYYTYRMTNDQGVTQNHLRHRILCYAFKPYPAHVHTLDVNHINGKPGDDDLDNLEWATRSENMDHAYRTGLRNDNKPVEVRDVVADRVYIFDSCSSAGRFLKVTETTVSNRCSSNGYRAYSGYQFRFFPSTEPWPEIELADAGKFLVEFPDGTKKQCGAQEAARHVGLTRTSLLRALREGRNYGTNLNKVTRIES